MVFSKAMSKLRNLASRKAKAAETEQTTSREPQIDVETSSSECEDNVAVSSNKRKQPENDEGEIQPVDALNLMFKYFDNRFNAMQNQLLENTRPPPFKKAKREVEYSFKRNGSIMSIF